MDMIDASAMLWRLHLRGVPVGDRWKALIGIDLDTKPGVYHAVVEPGGASVERGGDQAAAVATQERAGAVQDERSLARGAGLSGAAITTEDRRCKAASVDDQQRLCAGIPRDRFQVGKERT